MKKIFLLFFIITNLISIAETNNKLRAVSAAQFTTEILLAIKADDQIIGTAFLDDEILPELKDQYDKIPVLSKKAPTKEQFYSIEPNFLIGWNSIATDKYLGSKDELESNGVEVYFTRSQNSKNIEDIYFDILTLGKKFGLEENSKKVVEEMKNEIESLAVDNSKDKISIFGYDGQETAPFVVGGGGIANTLIEMAGGENIFKDSNFAFGTGTWEKVIDENPEYILIVEYGNVSSQDKIKFLKERSPISDIDAVKNNKFIIVPLSYLSSGIRVPKAIKLIADKLNK